MQATQFVRPIDDRQAVATGFPKYDVQVLAQQESSLFLASTIGAGGSGPGLHYHESDQTYFLLRGNMNIQLGDEVVQIEPGTLVHIPAGLPHRNWNDGPGTEVHLETIFPSPTPLQQIAHMIDDPSDIPPEHRTDRSGTVVHIGSLTLPEPLPGFKAAPLVDPGMGVDRAVVNYAEVANGGGIGRHVHEFDQFYFVLEGELTIEVALEKHVVGADTLVRLPAGVPHKNYNAAETTERHISYLLPPPVDGRPWDYGVDFAPNGDDHAGSFTTR